MAEKVAIEDTFEVPEEERRRAYETTVVFSAKVDEDVREALLSTMRSLIADSGGEIIEVSPKKEYTLAYPIQKETQGIMRTLVYRSSPELPNRLSRDLRHEKGLLRILTIEQPKRVAPRVRKGGYGDESSDGQKSSEGAPTDAKQMDEQIEGAISNL